LPVVQYLTGLLLGIACLGSVAAGARRLRRALLPQWSGAIAIVADAVASLSLLLIALEAVGSIGAFTRLGVLLACLLAGGAASLAAGRLGIPSNPAPGAHPAPVRTRSALCAAVAVAVVGAPWLGWTIFSLRHGMESIDTLWYHLPAAARFVQDASIWPLHYFDQEPITAFYPNNSELFHALGLLLFGSDVVSVFLNLGWATLALLAAWAIGQPYRRSPHCLIAVLLILGNPGLVDTQPGGALDDTVGIALLLASVALLLRGRDERSGQGYGAPATALAAAAAGLALGTKLSMVAPVLILAAVAVAGGDRGIRLRQAGIWFGALVLLGGFWYVRNLAFAGNPLPPLALHLGPLSLPSVRTDSATDVVATHLGDIHLWGPIFISGLRHSLGLAWWAVLFGAAAGWVGAMFSRDRMLRVLGWAGLLSGIAYLFTPQYLGAGSIFFGAFFSVNVRYSELSLVVGLVLVPLLPALRGRRAGAVILTLACAALAATELDPGVWGLDLGFQPISPPLSGAPALLGAALAATGLMLWMGAWAGRSRSRLSPARLGLPLVMAATALAVVAGWLVSNTYVHHRYRATPPLPKIYRWAGTVHHARIGLVGFPLQYPLYGSDNSNYVQYIGGRAPHAGFGPITSCDAWRAAVNAGRYAWVVVSPFGLPFGDAASKAPQWRWMAGTAAAPFIQDTTVVGERVILFHVLGALNPHTCPS
jgi:hypothetical protein